MVDYSTISREELEEKAYKFDKLTENPYYHPYVTNLMQLHKLSVAMRNLNITLGDKDDPSFKQYMEFSTKIDKINEQIEGQRKRLQPEEQKKAELEALKAQRGDAEYYTEDKFFARLEE
jgi:hypothetical protein